MPNSNWFVEALKQGWFAAKRNALAGFCLWCIGLAIVLAYYFNPFARTFFDRLGVVKENYGITFSIISTAIFGGLLPTLLAFASGQLERSKVVFLLIANVLFWGAKGVEIDLFYRFQAFVFGNQSNLNTIFWKSLVDQLVYAPPIGLLNVVLFSIWRDAYFSWAGLRAALTPGWYHRLVFPILISNWCVWLPAVVFIYLLPLALQLPIQNLVLVFWMLILTLLTQRPSAPALASS